MTTYAALVDRIQAEIDNDEITDTFAQNAILTAIAHYDDERFTWNLGYSQANTAAGTPRYALPTGFVEASSLVIEINGYDHPLTRKTPKQIDDMMGDTGFTGQPDYYAIHREELMLYPVPDDTYVLKMRFLDTLAELSADGDSNAWTTTAEDMIRYKAKAELYLDILHNPTLAALFDNKAEQSYVKLKSRTTRYHASGKMKSHAI